MAELDQEYYIKRALPGLMEFDDPALVYFTRRDLLGDQTGISAAFLELPELYKIIEGQEPEGHWVYPGNRKNSHPTENYHILQTYRMLGILIDQYGLDCSFPVIKRAAEYLLSHQTSEGDIRGIFGSQYAPHYTAGIFELLIKAGYQDDPRIARGITWFQGIQGEDGGWAWPLRTTGIDYYTAIEMDRPVQPDRGKPFSHALTGFVIRVFAAHPVYQKDPLSRQVGILMKGRFFQPDKYSDRKGVEYWLKFQYPFWWANLLTALDSLSKIGFSAQDPEIARGIDWFYKNQAENGFWPTGYGSGKGAGRNQAWVALAVCRTLKAFSEI